MLKMLIVDDEQFVIDGLKNALDWKKYDIDIVGEATDGKEAIDFISNHKVDILFTDIKMPILDGIQLIELVRSHNKDMKIVILSGYEDFNYAKSAIQNQVFEYLLKPITLDKIEELIIRLVQQYKTEYKKRQRRLETEKTLQKFRPLMEEQFYIDLLNGVHQKEMYPFLELNLGYNAYKVVVVNIDNLSPDRNRVISDKEKQSFILKILDLLKQECPMVSNFIAIQYNSISIALLFKFKNTNQVEYLISDLQNMQNKIFQHIGITVSFGIGNTYNHITEIHNSLKEANKALKYKLYYGNKSIICYSNIIFNSSGSSSSITDSKEDLVNSIKSIDPIKAQEALFNIYSLLKNDKSYTIEYIRKLSIDILLTLSFALYDKNEYLKNIYDEKRDLFEYVQHLDTLDDIFDTLYHGFATVIQYLKEKSESKNKNIITIITKYINDNISEDITLDKISQQVFLTPNYIGYIFKEEMGISFSEYVTQVRMEHAKELLKHPENKIYEVSQKVGYKNSHYFSKLFKKHTGINPSQYKS